MCRVQSAPTNAPLFMSKRDLLMLKETYVCRVQSAPPPELLPHFTNAILGFENARFGALNAASIANAIARLPQGSCFALDGGIYIYVYIYTHIYIYIHTYIHT